VARYEAHRRLVQQSAPHVAVMASGDEHLLTSFVLGTEGSIVSLAALIPEVVVALYEAVQCGELKTAQAAHEIVYPLARAIYGRQPASHATARLKTCLKLIGVLASDRVRPPLGELDIDEVKALQNALDQAGL
ncbi:MAG: dihydrodipicolinate synthase family protein, partial [Arenicellales bacterium]|nr:dihydrodipicolinate synthase family protein [Arenicellales bacterium]